ncbi:MAG: peptidylprolyl isomerase [Bacteroidales bacterium]|nr:peptidylprolyl isomerase [Bacteroidales bacterium]
MKYKTTVILISLMFHAAGLLAQRIIVDEVVAVIGDKKVLYSDVEQMFLQLKAQGETTNENTRCEILEDLMIQKLMINQAQIDSILVTDSQVEVEMEQRMRYFVNQFGSEQKLEAYYGKSILEIKDELRNDIRDQMLINGMRNQITQNISVTPSEVRSYYRSLPEDSLPYVDAEVEYNQIAIYPKSTEEAIFEVREKLLDIRERALNGESFVTLAVINSEDQASAIRGGDIGWFARSDLDADYAKAAFALKPGAISKIVETSFGYHLIQCVDKTDDRIQTRHILMKPKISAEEKNQAVSKLDSLVRLVRQDSVTFDDAARLYSEDEESKINGGQMVNLMRGGSRWRLDEFEPVEYDIISNLEVGEISNPYETTDNKGKTVFKVIWLKNLTEPHVANLKDDFNVFKEMAMQEKESEIVNQWVEEKIRSTYIRISDQYNSCTMSLTGWPHSGMAQRD